MPGSNIPNEEPGPSGYAEELKYSGQQQWTCVMEQNWDMCGLIPEYK